MNLLQIDYAFQNGDQVYWKGARYKLVIDVSMPLGYVVTDVYNGYCTALNESDLIDCIILEG